MDYGLKGKVALVTGTASQVGMGKAICLTLAQEGCDIVSTDINLEGAKQTADAVKALGRKCIAFKVDVTKGADVDAMVKAALKEFGKIDILVNNAGGNMIMGTPFLEQNSDMWNKDMALNLYGTMNCSKAVVPGMAERKYGKIINFSSIVAKWSLGGPGSYAASKAAVLSFTRGLASQFGPSNINVNAIAPGMVNTNFFGALPGNVQTAMFAEVAGMAPLKRNQEVSDIANAVAFLSSDVSRNITGQCIQVDSGLVMF
jgi:NAD(P)-dependent dehydrogenase (short-subunit alcohol dehydrogenase family)